MQSGGVSRRGVGALSAAALAVTVLVAAPSTASAATDTDAPQVTSVSLRSSTVTAGNPILLTYAASDAGSGVESVQAVYRAPDGAPILVISGTESGYGGAGLASGVVPVGMPAGLYSLDYLFVRDNAGNSTTYTPGAPTTVTTDPVGLTPPAAVDLSATALTVAQPGAADVTAPHLTAFSLVSSDRHLGEQATFRFTVTDASPVTDLRVFLDDPLGHHVVAHRRCGPFAPGAVSFWFPPDVATGDWVVTGVGVRDSAGNLRTYSPDGAGEQVDAPSHTGPSFIGMKVGVSAGVIRPDDDAVPDSCTEPVVTAALVSPYVTTGSTATVIGRVTVGGTAVASPWVALFAGDGAATRFVAVTTGTANGTWSLGTPVTATTTLRAYFLGSGTVGAPEAFAAPVQVRVGKAAKVVARDASITVPRGATRALAAHVAPRRSGVAVTLWRKKSGTWRSVTTTRTDGKGRVSVRVGRPSPKAVYRFTTAYAGGFLPATSATIRVTR